MRAVVEIVLRGLRGLVAGLREEPRARRGEQRLVVGGLFGFLAASLFEIVRTSLREALAAEQAGGVRRS